MENLGAYIYDLALSQTEAVEERDWDISFVPSLVPSLIVEEDGELDDDEEEGTFTPV